MTDTAHASTKFKLRLATTDDADLVANILADAFADDPVIRWIFPRAVCDESFMRVDVAECYLPLQHTWLDLDGQGAAAWQPPEQKPAKPPLLAMLGVYGNLLFRFGPAALRRGALLEQQFSEHRPRQPHYYLHMLGARRAMQGRGLGSALLAQTLQQVDQAGLPAWLESSSPKNVPLYERYGFRVRAEKKLRADGPTIWYMWREASPQSPSTDTLSTF